MEELQGHDYIECHNPFDLDAGSDVNARAENTTCLISTSDNFQYIICKGGTWEDTSLTICKSSQQMLFCHLLVWHLLKYLEAPLKKKQCRPRSDDSHRTI